MEKIALFDFCGTITNFQTFDPFLEFVITKEKSTWYVRNGVVKKLSIILSRIIPDYYFYKKLLIKGTKGIDYKIFQEDAAEYYEQYIANNIIKETIADIDKFRNEGYRIIIVSAGCDMYIKYFAEKHGITDVIATTLCFKEGKCSGSLKGADCIGKEKVKRIQQYFKEHHISGEIEYGYSDSISDKPMLDMCKNIVIISKNVHQKWIEKDMKEIIWYE